jgi:hypothetical protein
METQKTSYSQSNSEQNSNAGGIKISDFKRYYRAITIKSAWYCSKNRHEDQWIAIEDPDINLYSYRQLIFGKGAPNTLCKKKKRQPLQQMFQ